MYSAMQTLVILYGMDPEAMRIRAAWADDHVRGMSGLLTDDAVLFSTESMLSPFVTFDWSDSLVTAQPGGGVNMKFMAMTLSSREFNLQLHRELPVDAERPRNAP